MCGRATVVNPDGIVEQVYGFTKKFMPSDWTPRYNLNPREDIPVVYYDPILRERVLRPMHWNLIPAKLESRAKVDEFDGQYSCFNARIETVGRSQTFGDSWRTQRCLVVVDGMIEWVGEKRNKIPHLVRHRESLPFALTGVWSRWSDATGDEVWSCAVLVCNATKWYSRLHDRMAIVASPGVFDAWLDPDRGGGQLELLRSNPYPMSREFECYPISKLVNNPRNDSPDCLARAEIE